MVYYYRVLPRAKKSRRCFTAVSRSLFLLAAAAWESNAAGESERGRGNNGIARNGARRGEKEVPPRHPHPPAEREAILPLVQGKIG